MILYSVPVSLYCAKTRILLRHKALDYTETLPPGGYGAAAYKEIIPSGNLPAIDDNGFLLADSEAIAEYIEEAYPLPPALPSDLKTRAKARELGRFHDTRLEPAVRLLFPQVNPTPDPTALLKAEDAINLRLGQLDQMLSPSDGKTLTLGDCGYPPSFLWIDSLANHFGLTINWPDNVQTYRKQLDDIPAVTEEMTAYSAIPAPWIASKL